MSAARVFSAIDDIKINEAKEALIKANLIKSDIDVQEADRKRIEEAQKNAVNAPFTHDDINKAVMDIFDIQERSLLHFIFLGEIAKALHENTKLPIVEQIEITLPKSQITYEVKSLFTTWNMRETTFGFEYDYVVPLKWSTKIPVKIYVFKEKFKLFDSPDQVWAAGDSAFIPNPFDKYWPLRHLVKAKLEKGMSLSSEKL